jgi:lysozyme
VRTGEVGVELIKKYEGFSARPYLCPANVPTIGFGSTRWFDGYRITMDSRTISRDDATRLLQMELHHIESAVPRLIKLHLLKTNLMRSRHSPLTLDQVACNPRHYGRG